MFYLLLFTIIFTIFVFLCILFFLYKERFNYLKFLDYMCESYFLYNIYFQHILPLEKEKMFLFENLNDLRKKYIKEIYNSLSILVIFSLLTLFKKKENIFLYIGLKFDEQVLNKKVIK